MIRTLRYTSALVCALVLVGCGGGSDGGDGKSGKRDATRDARAGYFHKEQSDKLNPLLATYASAFSTYTDGQKTCETRKQQLYDAGAPTRKLYACHIASQVRLRTAVDELGDGFEGIGGTYRKDCVTELDRTVSLLRELSSVLEDRQKALQRYADGSVDPAIAKDLSKSGDALGTGRDDIRAQFPRFAEACYTKSDIEQAAQEQEQDAADDAATG